MLEVGVLALDDVPALVSPRVQAHGAPAGRAVVSAVAPLVSRLGDDGLDATGAQVGADCPRGLRRVADHRVGADAGPSYQPVHTQPPQQQEQYRGVPCLARGDQADQWQPCPIDKLVDLRAQPAT